MIPNTCYLMWQWNKINKNITTKLRVLKSKNLKSSRRLIHRQAFHKLWSELTQAKLWASLQGFCPNEDKAEIMKLRNLKFDFELWFENFSQVLMSNWNTGKQQQCKINNNYNYCNKNNSSILMLVQNVTNLLRQMKIEISCYHLHPPNAHLGSKGCSSIKFHGVDECSKLLVEFNEAPRVWIRVEKGTQLADKFWCFENHQEESLRLSGVVDDECLQEDWNFDCL